MDEIRYTLLSDGPSDRALIPLLTWVLREKGDVNRVQAEWADLGRLPKPPKSLCDRILSAIDLFPCDLLFVHRDAEREEPEKRYEEIRSAIREATSRGFQTPAVCVVPVQMTEAWLLFDEFAIRLAAGNPNGKDPLNLPELPKIEQIPNPKDILFQVLREASGLTARRLKKFNLAGARIRITELISDFSPLRALSAFQELERTVLILSQKGWIFDI
ncbi:MAG: DUF4276 family protein [Deltaproteobacteria bacterium]|nr:DUF4276 family protein [Deltaproteobacteria bacterium]